MVLELQDTAFFCDNSQEKKSDERENINIFVFVFQLSSVGTIPNDWNKCLGRG